MAPLPTNLEIIRQQGRCTTGPGWWPIIDQLLEEILKAEPSAAAMDPASMEIKEKYGQLSISLFYGTFQNPQRIDALIHEAEEKSRHTCEECGKPGIARDVNGWISTLCNECFSTRK